MTRTQGYAGRRIVVAGAGTGAGRALALLAAQAGARVAVGARTAARVEETVALARGAGDGEAAGFVVDLAVREQTESFLSRAEAALGGVDAVFCLAGGWFEGALHTQDASHIDDAYERFLKSTLVLNQVAPTFLKRGHLPALINFGSATGTAATVANQTLYNTMKAAVAELTRSLAADLMADGIRVNAVLPGAISHTYEHGRDYRGLRRLGGLVGTPEDAAHAALFLASPEASWITGACLVVDGGFHVNRRHGPD